MTRPTTRRVLWLLMVMVVLERAPAAHSASTRAFRQTTAKDFEEGEAAGSMILPGGEIVPGMVTERVPVDAAFVWCAATSRDGRTTYFGSGDTGKIFAVDAKASGGARKEAARRVATVDAPWVTALAVRTDDTLLAGTTPGARVFTVNPRTGGTKELANLPADHVWALVHDAKSGITYAATGVPGKVFSIDARGKVSQLWDPADKHVVSLVQAPDGTLLAGTSEEGILFRLRTDGHAEAVSDFDAEEVRAIAVDAQGTIFLAVNDFEKPSGAATKESSPSPPARGTKIAVAGGSPSSAAAVARPGQRKSKAAVYQIDPEGRIEQTFALAEGYLTSLLPDGDGGVYAAAGALGRIYRVRADRTTALAVDLPERQTLALARADGGLLIGTGDVAGVYRAQPSREHDARYLSKVFDAEYASRWGMLEWRGARGVGFETRSGNTARPDASWTSWRRLESPATSREGGRGRIGSPAGRYLQYRATLGQAGATLRDVAAYYLPQNQRARIGELTLGESKDSTTSGTSTTTTTPPAGGHPAHSPVLKLRWKVENPDGDELVYRLSFREESETVWRPLGGPDPLGKPEYDWNSESVPDGLYVIRVVASDERSNPRERALESTFVSPPLLVDNRKPDVTGLEVKGADVRGRAHDEASNITALECSIDGGEWKYLAPSDGIFDDRVETFAFKLPMLSPGPHSLTVRTWDAADNVGAAQVTFSVAGQKK